MTTDAGSYINDLIKAEVSLPRHEDSWEAVAMRAAEWIWSENRSKFSGLTVQAFFSDRSARPDNRISRYFKYTRLKSFKGGAFSDSEIIHENAVECDEGIFFWIHFKPTAKSLADILERLRHSRGDFIFMANEDFCVNRLVEIMIGPRLHGRFTDIDDPDIRISLINTGINLIRTWGSFDDREMWVEIY